MSIQLVLLIVRFVALIACCIALFFAVRAYLKLVKFPQQSRDIQSSLRISSIELSLLKSEYAVLAILASTMLFVGAKVYQLSVALLLENYHSTASIITVLTEIEQYVKVSLYISALLIVIIGAMRITLSKQR